MVEELLKKIEECENSIDYEKHRDKYLDKLVHSYPILSLSEEKELFKLYRTNYERKYKDIIFKCYLRYVHDTCKDTSSNRDDLISEGIVLLCEFIDSYDNSMYYITFKEALVTRLYILYTSKMMENEKSKDREISLQELNKLEKKDIIPSNEFNYNKRNLYNRKIIELKEELIIVSNKPSTYDMLFDYNPKILINKPIRRSNNSLIDY